MNVRDHSLLVLVAALLLWEAPYVVAFVRIAVALIRYRI
jgi:hypothetical protein